MPEGQVPLNRPFPWSTTRLFLEFDIYQGTALTQLARLPAPPAPPGGRDGSSAKRDSLSASRHDSAMPERGLPCLRLSLTSMGLGSGRICNLRLSSCRSHQARAI